ncbi:NAD(P)-dependent oxidoreductase [Castellaniella sp. GW247-6E4]|uniref:NAD(P)-dependent oxidoreductase n=1 Tax=Castellaniella sp. GW247-6E4 TaxID=3140380 RepID=UPI003315768A
MKKPKVLYVSSRPSRHQDIALQAAPDELAVAMCGPGDHGEILRQLADADFLISDRALDIGADMLAAGKSLRLVQRIGRLVHDIDLAEARRRDIPVCYLPVQRCAKVAEHAMMQTLILQRNYRLLESLLRLSPGTDAVKCDANTFAYNWTGAESVHSLIGACVGIVGFGEIGAELALRLQPFGARVLYHKRSRLPAGTERSLGIEHGSLAEVLRQSDVVVILLPHSDHTAGMVDSRFIAQMKPGAMLVATGASTALNERDVAAAYRASAIAGVATDGWNYEPVEEGNPLLALAEDPRANVAFTPHVAAGSGTIDWDERRAEYANILRLIRGEPLLYQAMPAD